MNANNSTLGPNDLNPPFTPDPSSIRQNCTFIASLCSSILAAAGAVLAKEWLQNYERTEEGGLDKGQALRRTARWIGVDGWMLLPVVQSLPTILLISLALFFVALCDYLLSISKPVAVVVILFVLVGTALYGFTVFAAVFDLACPFQTAVSRILRHVIRRGGKIAEEASRWTSIGNAYWDTHMSGFTWSFDSHDGKISEREQELYVKSTLWMLEFATEEEDVLSVAANIPTLYDLESTKHIANSPLSTKLVQNFKKSIAVIPHGADVDAATTTIYLQRALALAQAVAHVFLADPMGIDKTAARELSELGMEPAGIKASEELRQLNGLCTGLLALVRGVSVGNGKGDEYTLAMNEAAESMKNAPPAISLAFWSLYKLCYSGALIERGLSDGPRSDKLLSLACLEVTDAADTKGEVDDERVKQVWLARTGEDLGTYLGQAFSAFKEQVEKGNLDYTTIESLARPLMAFRKSHSSSTQSLALKTTTPSATIVDHLSEILSFRYTRTSVEKPTAAQSALGDELMAYAVQLLLSLGCEALIGGEWTPSIEEARKVAESMDDLEPAIVTDSDLVDVLNILHRALRGEDYARKPMSLTPGVSALIVHSLASESIAVRDTAYQLLNMVGEDSWDEDQGHKGDSLPPLILSGSVALATIQSLNNDLLLGNISSGEWKDYGTKSKETKPLTGLTRWLAASSRDVQFQSLVLKVDQSDIISLFIRILSRVDDQSWKEVSADGWQAMRDVTFLFLRTWQAMPRSMLPIGHRGERSEDTGAMSDEAFKALALYAIQGMKRLERNATNKQLVQDAFTFIEQAFISRPAAALIFQLDEACGVLIGRVSWWEMQAGGQLAEDASLRACRETAKRAMAYVRAGHLRDNAGMNLGNL
ncbi:hypothetical protein FRB95_013019 [Tulasnella sp. JGI-2019a]|nr:hypothetical protein FRB95_013019 [Tulasnella sp. JGI-2019a]